MTKWRRARKSWNPQDALGPAWALMARHPTAAGLWTQRESQYSTWNLWLSQRLTATLSGHCFFHTVADPQIYTGTSSRRGMATQLGGVFFLPPWVFSPLLGLWEFCLPYAEGECLLGRQSSKILGHPLDSVFQSMKLCGTSFPLAILESLPGKM